MRHSVRTALAVAALAALTPRPACSQSFTSGNVVVYRVGSGTGSLVNTGSNVFLDEFSPTGTLVQSVPLASDFIASGTATSEGLISRSPDGQFLTATGYKAATGGGASLSGTAAATVNRSVLVFGGSTAALSRTDLTDFADGNNPRSAVTTNGTDIWVTGGASGIRYTTAGSTTSTQLSTAPTNLRQVNIFDGQLYVSTSSGTSVRVGTVGTGTPTTADQTITNVPGFPTAGSPFSFAFFDLSAAVPGVDTLYVADDGAAALTKYSLVGGNWVSNGTVGVDADDYRGLTGRVVGTDVELFATRRGGSAAAGGGELVRLVDAAGYNATFTSTPVLLATAGANTAFRGIAFTPAPVPEPGSVLLVVAGVGLAGFARRRFARPAN